MAKTKRRWLVLDYTNPDALRAEDIPFDATKSVKDAILDNAGSIGLTGVEGVTGISGGPPGATGLAGGPGSQGVTGLRGVPGTQGPIGPTGETGIAPVSLIPSSYVTSSTPVDATSTDYQDVLSTTLQVDSSSQIFGSFSFEAESIGAGSYPTGGFRVVINDTSEGSELQKFFLPDDVAMGTVTHYAGPFTPSTYNIVGQVRKVSGQQKVRVNNAQLYAQSFIGGKGDVGPTGYTGIQGIGSTGTQGETGVRGPFGNTGLYGPTGIQGHTGLGVQGYPGETGIEGVGIQGVTGLEGLVQAVALPSVFATLDSTNQLYDNTSFIDIPGLSSLSLEVDASSSYIYSTLTLETDSTGDDSTQSYVSGAFRIVVDGTQSIEFNRFVQNNDDLEVDTISFRAGPFDIGTYTISGQARKDSTEGFGERHFQIRKGYLYAQTLQGGQGPAGSPGAIGYTGLQGNTGLGVQGYTGFNGPTGIKGDTGIQGVTGPYGPAGLTGSPGIQGPTGFRGITGVGFQGTTGNQGVIGITGVVGLTGFQGVGGITGAPGIGETGIQGIQGGTGIKGITGISSLQSIYNPINRYSVVDTSGSEVWLVSGSTARTGIIWNRSGTVLTLYKDSHGHSIGDRVIVRNTNQDYLNTVIDTTDSTSFSVATSSSDGTFGIDGAYSLGFTYAHDGMPVSGGTLSAPTGVSADVQLLSMRIRTGSRAGTTYDVVVPASAINGAGANTSLSDCYIPDFNVRMDTDSLSAIAATIKTGMAGTGSYSTFRIGNLGSDSRLIILHF